MGKLAALNVPKVLTQQPQALPVFPNAYHLLKRPVLQKTKFAAMDSVYPIMITIIVAIASEAILVCSQRSQLLLTHFLLHFKAPIVK